MNNRPAPAAPLTLFDRIWNDHCISDVGDAESLLCIDRIFLHERTGSIALESLDDQGYPIKNPQHVFCTIDHIVDTLPGRSDITIMPAGQQFIGSTRKSARAAGIHFFDIDDPRQGIVHVVSPEQGIALPGCIVVCPDSHTCTLGGLGAFGWGIGSTDAEHAMASSTLRAARPGNLRVRFEGKAQPGVKAKDMILHLLGRFGANGGRGRAVEFAGSAVRALEIEDRLTLCNMGVEFAAFTALIAPDDKTFEYVNGRNYAPKEALWDAALEYWRTLKSDDDAAFGEEIEIDMRDVAVTVTWGTSPEHTMAIDACVPDPADEADTDKRRAMQRALAYMDLKPGIRAEDIPIDVAFIGSCTNSRLSNLRAAAEQLRGRRVASGVKALCVPGSSQVKREAEAEGLDKIFKQAGFEWREAGCSLCFFAGGESVGEGKRIVSSTNRNFENRQGPSNRTHLASAVVVAASAVNGKLSRPDAM